MKISGQKATEAEMGQCGCGIFAQKQAQIEILGGIAGRIGQCFTADLWPPAFLSLLPTGCVFDNMSLFHDIVVFVPSYNLGG